MNYLAIYNRLCMRGKAVREGYKETHHIQPRCMGGTDLASNLTQLLPEEHFLAHQLLMKIYPRNYLLGLAVIRMTGAKQVCPGRSKNKLYGWVRRRVSSLASIALSGRALTDEHKQKIGDAHRSRHISEAHKEAVRKARTGCKLSSEHRAKCSASLKGRIVSPETRVKNAEAGRKRIVTDEMKLNMSMSAKARCARQKEEGFKPNPFSDEAKKKMSAAAKQRCAQQKSLKFIETPSNSASYVRHSSV